MDRVQQTNPGKDLTRIHPGDVIVIPLARLSEVELLRTSVQDLEGNVRERDIKIRSLTEELKKTQGDIHTLTERNKVIEPIAEAAERYLRVITILGIVFVLACVALLILFFDKKQNTKKIARLKEEADALQASDTKRRAEYARHIVKLGELAKLSDDEIERRERYLTQLLASPPEVQAKVVRLTRPVGGKSASS